MHFYMGDIQTRRWIEKFKNFSMKCDGFGDIKIVLKVSLEKLKSNFAE